MRWYERTRPYMKKLNGGKEHHPLGAYTIPASHVIERTPNGPPHSATEMIQTVVGPQMLHAGEGKIENADGSLTIINAKDMQAINQKTGMAGFDAGGVTAPTLPPGYGKMHNPDGTISMVPQQVLNSVQGRANMKGYDDVPSGTDTDQLTDNTQGSPSINDQNANTSGNTGAAFGASGSINNSGGSSPVAPTLPSNNNLSIASQMPPGEVSNTQTTTAPNGGRGGDVTGLPNYIPPTSTPSQAVSTLPATTSPLDSYTQAAQEAEQNYIKQTNSQNQTNAQLAASNPNLTAGAKSAAQAEGVLSQQAGLANIENTNAAAKAAAMPGLEATAATTAASTITQVFNEAGQGAAFQNGGWVNNATVTQALASDYSLSHNGATLNLNDPAQKQWAQDTVNASIPTQFNISNTVDNVVTSGILSKYEVNGQLPPQLKTEVENALSAAYLSGGVDANGNITDMSKVVWPWEDPADITQFQDFSNNELPAGGTMNLAAAVPQTGTSVTNSSGKPLTNGDLLNFYNALPKSGTGAQSTFVKTDSTTGKTIIDTAALLRAYSASQGHGSANNAAPGTGVYSHDSYAAAIDQPNPDGSYPYQFTSGQTALLNPDSDNTLDGVVRSDGTKLTVGAADSSQLSYLWYQFSQNQSINPSGQPMTAQAFAVALEGHPVEIDSTGAVTNWNFDPSKGVESPFSTALASQIGKSWSKTDAGGLTQENVVRTGGFLGIGTTVNYAYTWSNPMKAQLDSAISSKVPIKLGGTALQVLSYVGNASYSNARPQMTANVTLPSGQKINNATVVLNDDGTFTINGTAYTRSQLGL